MIIWFSVSLTTNYIFPLIGLRFRSDCHTTNSDTSLKENFIGGPTVSFSLYKRNDRNISFEF